MTQSVGEERADEHAGPHSVAAENERREAIKQAAGAGEPFYAEVTDWRAATGLSVRERLAAEFAERFAIDHLAMDDAFWDRLHAAFSDEELADLTICCGMFLGMGRTLAVVGVRAPAERILV